MRIAISILLAAGALAGCAKTITAEESAKQIKVCTDAGLQPLTVQDGWTMAIVQFVCVPKKEAPAP